MTSRKARVEVLQIMCVNIGSLPCKMERKGRERPFPDYPSTQCLMPWVMLTVLPEPFW